MTADPAPRAGRRVLVAVLAVTLGIVLALVAGEVLVRIAGRVLHRRQVVASHPRMGWAGWPKLNRAAKTYANGTFRLSTDSLGRRLAYPADRQPSAAAPVLLLVGDSFVQGIGVEDEETLAWQLALARPDRRVINLGVAGYGTDQMLLSVEDFFRTDSSKVSDIVVLAYENDFRDVQNTFDYALARAKPSFHLAGGNVERSAFSRPFLDRLMDRSELVWLLRSKIMYALRPPKLAADAGVDLAIASLDSIRAVGRAKGASVVVFAHRQLGPPLGLPSEVRDSVWTDFIERSRAIDLTQAVRAGSGTPIGFDRLHWNAEGHRRVAQRILATLEAGR
jgi:hypothetical protein